MKKIHDILKTNKKIIIGIGFLGLLIHILFFQSINSVMLLPPLLYWICLGILYRLNEKYYFAIALVFLVLSVPFFLLGQFELTEKLSVWEYLFLILGLLQWALLEVPFLKNKLSF